MCSHAKQDSDRHTGERSKCTHMVLSRRYEENSLIINLHEHIYFNHDVIQICLYILFRRENIDKRDDSLCPSCLHQVNFFAHTHTGVSFPQKSQLPGTGTFFASRCFTAAFLISCKEASSQSIFDLQSGTELQHQSRPHPTILIKQAQHDRHAEQKSTSPIRR